MSRFHAAWFARRRRYSHYPRLTRCFADLSQTCLRELFAAFIPLRSLLLKQRHVAAPVTTPVARVIFAVLMLASCYFDAAVDAVAHALSAAAAMF